MVSIITGATMLLLYGRENLTEAWSWLNDYLGGWRGWQREGRGKRVGFSHQSWTINSTQMLNPSLVTAKIWGLSGSVVCGCSRRWKNSHKPPEHGGRTGLYEPLPALPLSEKHSKGWTRYTPDRYTTQVFQGLVALTQNAHVHTLDLWGCICRQFHQMGVWRSFHTCCLCLGPQLSSIAMCYIRQMFSVKKKKKRNLLFELIII